MTDTANRRREPATVRVAMWSSRHRWPVAAAWFVGTIAVFVLSALTGGIRAEDANGSPNQAQTESAKASPSSTRAAPGRRPRTCCSSSRTRT